MNTTLTYEELLAELERDIHFTALRYRHLAEVEDLEQEARIQIWQALGRINQVEYPMNYAKGVAHKAMLRFLARKQRSVNAESLEEYLCWQDKDGDTVQRDIPDIPNPKRLSSLAVRRRVLAALNQLTPAQRSAVMVFYRIENNQGRVRDVQKKRRTLEGARYLGMVRLRKLMV